MRVLLLAPKTPETFWSFAHVVRMVSRKCAFPPLGLLTVAAMLPRDWQLELVDLNVEDLEDEQIDRADYVMIGGMIVHGESVRELVRRCAARGRPIIGGGPLFTTGHEDFPEVRHVVIGEAEPVMAELVRDMERGEVAATYQASERPDVTRTPRPRWDLIELSDYVTMAVQFSRGCPYDCEFCDIVVMNGRVPRTKSPGQLVAELEDLRVLGWREMVFVVDDNFIGNRRRAKELLREMIAWRERTGAAMGFLTEASINLVDDAELCDLMIRAGFKKVFVGIESPALDSLAECHKTQNKGRDLVEVVHALQRRGLEVMGGFIVGFDSDPSDIYRRQFEFIQRSGVATAMVGLLTALPKTRLYQRLAGEGRLIAKSSGNNTQSVLNFESRLDREFLEQGYRQLMQRLYEPRTYYRRMRVFLANHRPRGPRSPLTRDDLRASLRSLWLLGVRTRGRCAYWRILGGTLLRRPRQLRVVIELAIMGHHFRTVAARI